VFLPPRSTSWQADCPPLLGNSKADLSVPRPAGHVQSTAKRRLRTRSVAQFRCYYVFTYIESNHRLVELKNRKEARMECLRNAWYPVCRANALDEGLFAQQVLGERIVFFRKSDGNVAALEDLCPHRFLPLSKGRRCGDAIECGYHGLVFEADGRCSRIPGQPVVPSSAKVRSYPTGESMGLIWIWMGEPPIADPSRLYRLPQYDDHRWRAVHGG